MVQASSDAATVFPDVRIRLDLVPLELKLVSAHDALCRPAVSHTPRWHTARPDRNGESTRCRPAPRGSRELNADDPWIDAWAMAADATRLTTDLDFSHLKAPGWQVQFFYTR